ncbi:RNB domain-containing ribonuclease [Thermodesulfobacteriota bacterium]
MKDLKEGKIIEYIDQGKFVCTVCIQDRGNRLQALTPSNREISFSPKRAMLISSASISILSPREQLLNKLKETEALRKRLQQEVQVPELWELIRDENQSFDYQYLTHLCFGETITDDHVSALVRALFHDKIFFKLKDGRFAPNPEKRVDEIIKQRELAAEREEKLKAGSDWIENVLQGKAVPPPSCREEVIELLVNLALHGHDTPDSQYGKDLLSRLGISDIQKARELLVRLGVWQEDENLDLIRFDIRASFGPESLHEAEKVSTVDVKRDHREDLRDLDIFTIDGPLTQDFDDALSLEVVGDKLHVGVHIADVASLISPDGPLDHEASQRASSLYLPRRQIPMFPPSLSQDALSLLKDRDRPAISLLATMGGSGDVVDYRFTPSLIRVRRHLTYDEVNRLYLQEEGIKQFLQLSQSLRQMRNARDALTLSTPEAFISVAPDGMVSIEMIAQDTPSRLMVAEMMILYNWLAARFCRDRDIPILYRGQGEPSERLSADGMEPIYFVFKQRRKLNRLEIGTKPSKHSGLGLDVYTNVSSPIRRYFDLILQRQMSHFFLHEKPLYNKEELEQKRVAIEPVLKGLGRIKRNRTRYWIQKYLLQHMDDTFTALVLQTLRNRYRILLTDFLLITEMRRQNGVDFEEGDRVRVKVKKSDPWSDSLSLEFVN